MVVFHKFGPFKSLSLLLLQATPRESAETQHQRVHNTRHTGDWSLEPASVERVHERVRRDLARHTPHARRGDGSSSLFISTVLCGLSVRGLLYLYVSTSLRYGLVC